MDGENNGKPYFLMDDLGVPLFSETPKCAWSGYRNYDGLPTPIAATTTQKRCCSFARYISHS